MFDMTGEAVRDIDELSERLMARGILKFRLRSSMLPLDGVNHRQRREFGLE